MKQTLTFDLVSGFIRHALTGVGYVLIYLGYMNKGSVEEIAGAIAAVLGHVWSSWRKIKRAVSAKP